MTDEFSEMIFEVSEIEFEQMLNAIHKPTVLCGYRFEIQVRKVSDYPHPTSPEPERQN